MQTQNVNKIALGLVYDLAAEYVINHLSEALTVSESEREIRKALDVVWAMLLEMED